MPSGRDAHADPVFPQAAFPAPHGLPASVRLLPNPATFRANEIVIGAASPDFLKQVMAPSHADGFTRLTRNAREWRMCVLCGDFSGAALMSEHLTRSIAAAFVFCVPMGACHAKTRCHMASVALTVHLE